MQNSLFLEKRSMGRKIKSKMDLESKELIPESPDKYELPDFARGNQ